MAYAIIAGVNPVYGLYTAIISTIIGAAFGSSNHLIGGPTNAISLLVASSMRSYMGLDNVYEMLFLMTFMVGIIQILFGVIKLGRAINISIALYLRETNKVPVKAVRPERNANKI